MPMPDFDDEDVKPARHAWDLGYAKIIDKWQLAIREVWVSCDEDGTQQNAVELAPKPLLSAPRHVRVAAAGEISKLVDLIKARAEVSIRGIEKAEKLAEEL